jgi:hypothetical protein
MPPLAIKEALFRKALDRFVNGPAAYTQKALKEPTVRAVVERLLQGAADLNAAPRIPANLPRRVNSALRFWTVPDQGIEVPSWA